MTLQIIHNATCTACSCVCDDIELHHDDVRIHEARRACELGTPWFLNYTTAKNFPAALIDGKEATLDQAVAAAADYLHAADMPLIYGLSNTSCEAQKECVALADQLGGLLDSDRHDLTQIAVQMGGKVTCTLGEVKQRADLVVYWGVDPEESYPRHMSRYTVMRKSKFLPHGRADRTMVLVNVEESKSSEEADLVLRVTPASDFELIAILCAMLRGHEVADSAIAETGLNREQLVDLITRMKSCKFGCFFFSTGLSMTRGNYMNSASILLLAAELNAFTKFVAMPMPGHGNVTGADAVMRWQTGYPFSVSFNRGYPRYNPGEFSTEEVLSRGDCDAAIIIGADPVPALPPAAIDHLRRIPTIVLDPQITRTSQLARVHITTAPHGLAAGGTAYRMDELSMPLKPALTSPYPTDIEVIQKIKAAVAEKPFWLAEGSQPRMLHAE